MSKCTTVEIEQRIGSEVEHLVSLAPKKNHGAMMQLNQQYGEIIKNYGVPHLVFQLSNTMAGITNTAKTISYTEEDEACSEILSIGIASIKVKQLHI